MHKAPATQCPATRQTGIAIRPTAQIRHFLTNEIPDPDFSEEVSSPIDNGDGFKTVTVRVGAPIDSDAKFLRFEVIGTAADQGRSSAKS